MSSDSLNESNKGRHRAMRSPGTARRVVTTASAGIALPLLGAGVANAADAHKVESGDTLSSIAKSEHVDGGWKKLYEANKSEVGGDPNLIMPGQQLSLDGSDAPKQKTSAKPSSDEHQQKRYVSHVVKTGETLGSIATHYDVPGGWQRVFQDNKGAVGSNPQHLKVGTKLTVDRKGGAVAKPVQTPHQSTAKKKSSGSDHSQRASRSEQRSSPSKSTGGSPKDIARQIVPSGQFQCFSNIVERESGWNPSAKNPTSAAYGLVQANPGSKMSSAGSDWRSNPETQIKWGLQYMNSKYGSPCGAWSFWQSHHAY